MMAVESGSLVLPLGCSTPGSRYQRLPGIFQNRLVKVGRLADGADSYQPHPRRLAPPGLFSGSPADNQNGEATRSSHHYEPPVLTDWHKHKPRPSRYQDVRTPNLEFFSKPLICRGQVFYDRDNLAAPDAAAGGHEVEKGEMPVDFKAFLKSLRLRAGYGLREFAEMIGDAPSNYAGIEAGDRKPWRDPEKLRRVAEALELEEGSPDWNALILGARRKGTLPEDMERLLDRPMIPLLLRTVDELQLSEGDLRRLVERLRKTHKRASE
jgi:transcriptional regulator with XRE-family HTH domain